MKAQTPHLAANVQGELKVGAKLGISASIVPLSSFL
jgi:hypothetical protein